jgi:hypothetical protein
MTAIDPERVPEAERSSGAQRMPDPWGVKRAENLLTSLDGVLSARVVVSPVGEITEIHVLAQAGNAPKQVVRNVESALLAQLGVKVDHRKISVAQTAEVQPIAALEQNTVRELALKRAILFQRVDVRPSRASRVAVAVSLLVDGNDVAGEVDCADTSKARVQGTARATVGALDKVLPQGTIELDGCKLVQAFDMEFAFAVVHCVEGRGDPRMLTGTCEVQDSEERAAALAVLDATNRWIQSRR